MAIIRRTRSSSRAAAPLPRDLSPYEREVGEAMTARRNAALNLSSVLADDVSRYESGMADVRAGRSLDILVVLPASRFRQSTNSAISEFESTRHRFRLALTAVALDRGLNARQIGEAFGFSRQLASQYVKEAREQWPDLHPANGERELERKDAVSH